MGENTHHTQASYTATNADALIESLRRVPQIYTLDLSAEDTQRMIELLESATPGNGENPGFMGLRPQLCEWLRRYQDHLDWKNERLGRGWPFTAWNVQTFKILLVMLFTISIGGGPGQADTFFTPANRKFARELYASILTTLDIELI